MTPPTAPTTAGTVRGHRENTLAVFRGIPYARPPFGPHRFRAPTPPLPWPGIRDATRFAPPVPQAPEPDVPHPDCLTLTVWTPDLTADLPVMVWIHGGAYLEGGSANPDHDGTALAASGVVLVSIDYRVGWEGFAHLDGAPDNRGILDQIAALTWVRDNIAEFGGDPGRVTVFGQSAGAGCIAALLAMPKAAGLFRRAIAQSVPGTFFTPALAADISATIAGRLGRAATVRDCADVPPRAFIDATTALIRTLPSYADRWGPLTVTPTPFSPIVDGELLPEPPWRALASGSSRDVDLLVGHTRDEFSLFTHRPDHEVTEADVDAAVTLLAPESGDRYRASFPTTSPAELSRIIHADWLFRMPSLHLAAARNAGGGRAWLYELTWAFNRDEGASHSLDVLLVFDTLSAERIRAHRAALPGAEREAVPLGRRMRADWLTFAATGDPGWPPYGRARTTRVYAAEPVTRPYPEEASRRIWFAHRFGVQDKGFRR
ncbi:carboxylesterase/lipase family protein [Nocardia sp. NPDC004068]|uniref:carboxylesterase/lipase family protein n=1 Tax=Nocardia sp. NPDC004068 TaxID=3364303 RepID=UPI0036756581